MPRNNVPLETALGQLLTETRLGQQKAASVQSKPVVVDPTSDGLRKLAAALRESAESEDVTYGDLNRVKEMLYGKR